MSGERCACCGQPIQPDAANLHAIEGFSPKERALLERLGKRPASVDELVVAIWGDNEPSDIKSSMNLLLHKTRRKLAQMKLGFEIINSRGIGYRITKTKP
jgi:DNA-binding response OmpR family regulator